MIDASDLISTRNGTGWPKDTPASIEAARPNNILVTIATKQRTRHVVLKLLERFNSSYRLDNIF